MLNGQQNLIQKIVDNSERGKQMMNKELAAKTAELHQIVKESSTEQKEEIHALRLSLEEFEKTLRKREEGIAQKEAAAKTEDISLGNIL